MYDNISIKENFTTISKNFVVNEKSYDKMKILRQITALIINCDRKIYNSWEQIHLNIITSI